MVFDTVQQSLKELDLSIENGEQRAEGRGLVCGTGTASVTGRVGHVHCKDRQV